MLRGTMLHFLRRAFQDTLKRPFADSSKRAPLPFLLLLTLITALLMSAQPLVAQGIRVGDAWQQVYELLPDFPRENQYISRENGKVAENNTLIGRLIRYHIYIKVRPVNYRLDWKLTLADYLGANERMPASTYPSADTLRINPFQNDVAVVRSLNRAQREALVQTLVNVFTASDRPEPNSVPTPQRPNAVPVAPIAPAPQREPRPGDAQLLLP